MLIQTKMEPMPFPEGTVTALGFFDGVHSGHRAVIEAALKKAEELEIPGCVFTFEPPKNTDRQVSKSHIRLIQTEKERTHIMEEMGVRGIFVPPFESFYNLNPEEFIRKILVEILHAKAVSCGENYRFGAKGAGNASLLKELCGKAGIEVLVVPPVMKDGEPVSSTRIRSAMEAGDMPEVTKMLGYAYGFDSVFWPRAKKLRQYWSDDMALPAEGEYESMINGTLKGLTRVRIANDEAYMETTSDAPGFSEITSPARVELLRKID